MKKGITKFLLIIFLTGFIYHITSFFIRIGYELIDILNTDDGMHLFSAAISLVLLILCYKIINRKDKTYDEDHHKINKIR